MTIFEEKSPNKKANSEVKDDKHFGVLLHIKDDFVVLSKPYDIRMNGDFPVTVESIIQKW